MLPWCTSACSLVVDTILCLDFCFKLIDIKEATWQLLERIYIDLVRRLYFRPACYTMWKVRFMSLVERAGRSRFVRGPVMRAGQTVCGRGHGGRPRNQLNWGLWGPGKKVTKAVARGKYVIAYKIVSRKCTGTSDLKWKKFQAFSKKRYLFLPPTACESTEFNVILSLGCVVDKMQSLSNLREKIGIVCTISMLSLRS